MGHGIGRRGEDEAWDREERHGIGRRGEDEAWDHASSSPLLPIFSPLYILTPTPGGGEDREGGDDR